MTTRCLKCGRKTDHQVWCQPCADNIHLVALEYNQIDEKRKQIKALQTIKAR